MRPLPDLLDILEAEAGPPEAVPSADGREFVLAENVAYLADDQRRWAALAELREAVGLAPEQVLAAPDGVLRRVVAGPQPDIRVQRLRRCAELAVAGTLWRSYPGIGQPGADRIELFTGSRPVPALDANALRVLARLGLTDPERSYQASYRQAQAALPVRRCRPRCRRFCAPASCSADTGRESAGARSRLASAARSRRTARAPGMPCRCTSACPIDLRSEHTSRNRT